MPAAVALPRGAVKPDRPGRIALLLVCSAGESGCAGTTTATLDDRPLGSATYAIAAGKDAFLHYRLDGHDRRSGGTLRLTVTPVIGAAQSSSSTLTLTSR